MYLLLVREADKTLVPSHSQRGRPDTEERRGGTACRLESSAGSSNQTAESSHHPEDRGK